MNIEIQNFDAPAIDWTKANVLYSGRFNVLILNDPTVEVGETVSGTVLQDTHPVDTPEEERFIVGKYYGDFDPLAFELFNGQILLSNS